MANTSVGAVDAKGMLVEWFDIISAAGQSALGPKLVEEIEYGRPDFSVRPGLIRKLLPVSVDQTTGAASSGGSYLFDSYDNAQEHLRWTHEDYRISGLLFAQQPWVANMGGFLGRVVGAHDFIPLAKSHASQRIQVWHVEKGDVDTLASGAWSRLVQCAQAANLASVWLGVDPSTRSIALVSVAPRSPDESGHDYQALQMLDRNAVVKEALPDLAAERVIVDKTMWVITIWLPPEDGRVTDGLWPNSPPLPGP